MSKLIRFYEGEIPDHMGRFINTIWRLDHFWLEHTHDYIQWLFPLPEKGRFNGFAPVLSERDRLAFRESAILRERQRISLDVMLDFLGLSRKENQIHAQQCLNIGQHIWLKPGGHNHLRITRMIRSLHRCAQEDLALVLKSAVLQLGTQKGIVSETSLAYWRSATD